MEKEKEKDENNGINMHLNSHFVFKNRIENFHIVLYLNWER